LKSPPARCSRTHASLRPRKQQLLLLSLLLLLLLLLLLTLLLLLLLLPRHDHHLQPQDGCSRHGVAWQDAARPPHPHPGHRPTHARCCQRRRGRARRSKATTGSTPSCPTTTTHQHAHHHRCSRSPRRWSTAVPLPRRPCQRRRWPCCRQAGRQRVPTPAPGGAGGGWHPRAAERQLPPVCVLCQGHVYMETGGLRCRAVTDVVTPPMWRGADSTTRQRHARTPPAWRGRVSWRGSAAGAEQ
jgi:hypothetical protein